MCGLFGFVTANGAGPSIERLKAIAAATEERGRDAFGLAWVDANGELQTFKRPGAASSRLADLNRCRDALAVVGHCRLATHGSWTDNRNNHPHRAGSGWIAHNGMVMNHERLADQYHVSPETECDSEVLGLMLARIAGSLERRATCMARAAQGPLAVMGVWRNPVRLLVVKNGKPLSFGQSRRGLYFGSLTGGIPNARIFCDATTGLLEFDGKALGIRSARIAQFPPIQKYLEFSETMADGPSHLGPTGYI